MPFVGHDHAKIYYEVHGRGPAIVLAHGASSNRLGWWQQVPHFAQKYRVIIFDHRCFGRSSCRTEDFSVAPLAGDVVAILDAEDIEQAAVIGHSMGGITAMTLATRHPHRVRCVALCHTPGCLRTVEAARCAALMTARLASATDIASATLTAEFCRRFPAKAFLYRQIAELNQGVAPRITAKLIAADGAGFIDPGEFAGYGVPTLILAAPEDRLIPVELLQHFADVIPGARFVDFPAPVGHASYFEEPDTFNAIMEGFLDLHQR